jgi:threonine-phosphate decarboxylase
LLRYEHGGNANYALDFSVNTNPLGTPESVKRAVREFADYSYPDPDCKKLRFALAKHHGIPPDMFLCGNGASELIMSVCAALKPKAAHIKQPTFSEYERCAELHKGGGADIMCICNPNNPTGQLADIPDTENLLLIDECFIEFSRGETMLPKLKERPNILVLRAFTKIYGMAGLRLGYLCSADTDLLVRIKEYLPAWNVSGIAQSAGIAALSEKDWLEKTLEILETEREFMTAELTSLGLSVTPSDCNILLIKSERPLREKLKQRGIFTRSCENFTGLDNKYIRIGLKTREENLVLLKAIGEVL